LKEAFCDPVIQDIAFNGVLRTAPGWYIEVGLKPGVTDNVGRSAEYALELITGSKTRVLSAKGYLVTGNLDASAARRIAEECLANTLIHTVRIFKSPPSGMLEPVLPMDPPPGAPVVEELSLEVDEEALERLSRERTLALSTDELRAVARHLRDPHALEGRSRVGLSGLITDVELECLAQTWSEHCKHKIFNAVIEYEEDGVTSTIDSLFSTYIKKATEEVRAALSDRDICVSVFTDNAGIIRFNETHNIVFKVETHNSPSALDPTAGR
jgi:phosphoribosylformylglycinamidine synthase